MKSILKMLASGYCDIFHFLGICFWICFITIIAPVMIISGAYYEDVRNLFLLIPWLGLVCYLVYLIKIGVR